MLRNKPALLSFLAVTTALMPLMAMAQENNGSETLEEIVVYGFVQSLSKAREEKRQANIVKDVIVAEDMAKFPELNLAESLQRLPGVAINREAGEGRRITLRGLGPDFTRVQLNGMEVLGNVDSAMDSRGQRSRDRAFDFNIFASELFSKVEVEKTFQAAQNEGGMAGTVGLFTGKPFDYKDGATGAVTAKIGTNSYTEDTQPRVAAMISQNWGDRFGVLLSAAYSERTTQEQGYNTYSPSQLSASQLKGYVAKGLDISTLSAAQQQKFLSGELVFASGNRLSVWDAKQERLGLTAAAQWRPSDEVLFTLDGLHGEFTTRRDEYHLATRPASTSGSVAFDVGSKIKAISWDNSNFVNDIDVENLTYASEHRRSRNENEFNQIALTGEWEPNDRFKLDGHIGYEKSSYTTPYDDKLYLQAKGGMRTRYDADGTGATNFYNWNTTDMSRYSFKEFYFREFWNETSLKEGVLNGRYTLTDGLTLRGGLAYHRYTSSGSETYNDGKFRQFGGTPVTAYGYVYDGNNKQSWIAGDYDKAFAQYNAFHTVAGATDIENTYRVTEETKAGYGQLDWDQPLGDMRLRGNIGVRGYFTDTNSTGNINNSSDTPLGSNKNKSDYSGVLPALNMALEVTPDFLVRFAATQNINRPSISSMSAAGTLTQTDGRYTVSVGNPNLKPYKDTSFDLAGEWYFSTIGMVSLGVFNKDIKNLISTETLYNVPYSATGLPATLMAGVTPNTVVAEYSRPVNLDDARITGLEVAAQTDFAFLPAPFDKLGVLANLTLIDSNSKIKGLKGPITGLSKTNANGTLYYETEEWGVRVSANYRSSYLRSRYDGSNPASEDGFDGSVYMDAAAFVALTPSIRLTLDAINITNEKEVQYNSIYHRLHNVTQSGTTVFAGVSLDF
ncbi:TonB-dependent receptor [Niveispirillum sp. BGYR6]|uniref:TonB-dependent receptor n=1 Tax=Niveispirillum sp. BGYR6 TaxID=2971249 RepID=UPI0022B97108|nr:TonB-dependent receptor [Niveispirillum sp. BGYR6]MDG5497447.1 TonB-dependent receptor [Niveispirillum sp. BGYR6]